MHVLLPNSACYVGNDWSSDFNCHNVDPSAYWHKIHGALTCPTAEKVVSYLVAKCKKIKWVIFGVEFNNVKNILKAIPEAQYSCSGSIQSKWFKRTANVKKKKKTRFLNMAKQPFC